MAGPCVEIYSAYAGDAAENLVAQIVAEVATSRKKRDFWVQDTRGISGGYNGQGRPFVWDVSSSNEWTDQPNEYERRQIGELLGAAPQTQVSFCAMCNDDCDHRVLGELALHVARELEGIICFLGLLHLARSVEDLRALRQLTAADMVSRFAAEVRTGGGTLVAFGLDPEDAPAMHYSDATFMEHWLQHSAFRMVK